jgi:hypothetical protein
VIGSKLLLRDVIGWFLLAMAWRDIQARVTFFYFKFFFKLESIWCSKEASSVVKLEFYYFYYFYLFYFFAFHKNK